MYFLIRLHMPLKHHFKSKYETPDKNQQKNLNYRCYMTEIPKPIRNVQ